MAKFSFRVSGSATQPDVENLELADRGVAWTEAARACADMLADSTERLEPGSHWELQVLDDADQVFGVFRFSAEAFTDLSPASDRSGPIDGDPKGRS